MRLRIRINTSGGKAHVRVGNKLLRHFTDTIECEPSKEIPAAIAYLRGLEIGIDHVDGSSPTPVTDSDKRAANYLQSAITSVCGRLSLVGGVNNTIDPLGKLDGYWLCELSETRLGVKGSVLDVSVYVKR